MITLAAIITSETLATKVPHCVRWIALKSWFPGRANELELNQKIYSMEKKINPEKGKWHVSNKSGLHYYSLFLVRLPGTMFIRRKWVDSYYHHQHRFFLTYISGHWLPGCFLDAFTGFRYLLVENKKEEKRGMES